MSKRPISEDSDLFRSAMAGVKRLREEPAPVDTPKPEPRARSSRDQRTGARSGAADDTTDAEPVGSGDTLSYRHDSVRLAVMRDLRRGRYPIRNELDLHGMTTSGARAALSEFIDECLAQDRDCVRIIHGKGQRSGSRGPVLKREVNGWLRRHHDVLAFVSAQPADGGTGAVYVLLKR